MTADIIEFPKNSYSVTITMRDESIVMDTIRASTPERVKEVIKRRYPQAANATVTPLGFLR